LCSLNGSTLFFLAKRKIKRLKRERYKDWGNKNLTQVQPKKEYNDVKLT
jgi:hypothetical protein